MNIIKAFNKKRAMGLNQHKEWCFAVRDESIVKIFKDSDEYANKTVFIVKSHSRASSSDLYYAYFMDGSVKEMDEFSFVKASVFSTLLYMAMPIYRKLTKGKELYV